MSSILLTGGIGDCFTVEAYFPPKLRSSLDTIYYALPAYKAVQSYFTKLYPQAKHVQLWGDFGAFPCFSNKLQLAEHYSRVGITLPERWREIEDWSIAAVFPRARKGELKHTGTSCCKTVLAPWRFDLPDKYWVITESTPNDQAEPYRRFTNQEWDNVISFLETRKEMAVVVNSPGEPIPYHWRVVNLIGKSTMLEAVEILKKAQGYIGIDSALSVLASRLFPPERVLIKMARPQGHGHRWKDVYYRPSHVKCVKQVLHRA